MTGNATFQLKVHVASAAELEALIDELGTLGARCSTTLVLSTPITDAPVVPPVGSVSQRSRLTRRRRRGPRVDEGQTSATTDTGAAPRRRNRARRKSEEPES